MTRSTVAPASAATTRPPAAICVICVHLRIKTSQNEGTKPKAARGHNDSKADRKNLCNLRNLRIKTSQNEGTKPKAPRGHNDSMADRKICAICEICG